MDEHRDLKTQRAIMDRELGLLSARIAGLKEQMAAHMANAPEKNSLEVARWGQIGLEQIRQLAELTTYGQALAVRATALDESAVRARQAALEAEIDQNIAAVGDLNERITAHLAAPRPDPGDTAAVIAHLKAGHDLDVEYDALTARTRTASLRADALRAQAAALSHSQPPQDAA